MHFDLNNTLKKLSKYFFVFYYFEFIQKNIYFIVIMEIKIFKKL